MNRKAYVDFAKCIAIFFVLMNHIGLTFPYVSAFGGMFYVPIFFFLSGYTYQEKEEPFSGFVCKKTKRLLLPYMVTNFFYFVFFFIKDHVLTGTVGVNSLKPLMGILYSRYSLYPPVEALQDKNVYFLTIQNSPTWFLTAIFLTYLLFEIGMRIAAVYREKQAENLCMAVTGGICLLMGVVLHYGCPILLPWSLECVPLFTVYMLAGNFFAKKNFMEGIWKKRGLYPYAVLVFLIAAAVMGYLLCGSANISVGDFGNYTVLGVINGIVSSFLVVYVCYPADRILPKNLCAVGKNTLHILCYHLFVFMFLITGCNLILPGRLDGTDAVAYVLKSAIVIGTVAIIMLADKGMKWILERRSTTAM